MLFRVDGMKIIKHIAEKKLNVVDFARQISISTSALNRAMNCDPINLKTVRKIADALGINVEDFITEKVLPKTTKYPTYEWRVLSPKKSNKRRKNK